MNRKLKRLFVIGSVACCLSAVPALSYEHGGDTRATAARESHSNSLGSWGDSRKPAEPGQPIWAKSIIMPSISMRRRCATRCQLLIGPARTRQSPQRVSNWRKTSASL